MLRGNFCFFLFPSQRLLVLLPITAPGGSFRTYMFSQPVSGPTLSSGAGRVTSPANWFIRSPGYFVFFRDGDLPQTIQSERIFGCLLGRLERGFLLCAGLIQRQDQNFQRPYGEILFERETHTEESRANTWKEKTERMGRLRPTL